MDSWVEDVEIDISRGVEGFRCEDDSEEKGCDDAQCVKTVRPKLRSSGEAGGGSSSSSLKHLVRPPLPGRKSYRKTSYKDNRGARSLENAMENQDLDEQIPISGGKLRQRKAGGFLRERVQEKREGGNLRSFPRSLSSVEFFGAWDFGESFDSPQCGHTCFGPSCLGCSQKNNVCLPTQGLQPTVRQVSSSPSESHIHSRPAPPSPQRLSSKGEPDTFWMEVRAEASTGELSRRHSPELGEDDEAKEEEENEGEDEENVEGEEEGAHGVTEVISHTVSHAGEQTSEHTGGRNTNNTGRRRSRCRGRRKRRHQVWREIQGHESRQSSTGSTCSSSSSSSDDGDISPGDKEGYICAVCLDVYFSPYMCHPCNHIFCEPCLRTLAKNSPTNTPCPLCRTVITHVFFQKELNHTARTFFPNEYLSRKQNFQRTSYPKWPLPSCRKFFRIFGNFQSPSSPTARRPFPHRGGYHLDAMDFQSDSRRWGFDMDMVIIYIHSVNWIVAFFIFGFLCYLLFSTF